MNLNRQLLRLNIGLIALTMVCSLIPIERGKAIKVIGPEPFAGDDVSLETVNQDANRYVRAVNEISSISSMTLKTEADFKKAGTIINTNINALRAARRRMIQIALTNTMFTKALETEFDKASGDDVAMRRRFRDTPSLLTGLNGASQVQQSIGDAMRRDYQTIKTAGNHLKSEVDAYGRRRAHAASNSSVISENEQPFVASDYIETLLAATNIYVGVIQAKKRAIRAPSKGDLGAGPGGSGSSSSSNSQHIDYSCDRSADAAQKKCKGECEGMPDWLCAVGCDAERLVAAAECALGL